ncbi:hypothetical protein F4809DRAFT_649585 [Biscogniauxia mediterranea]|nr:hypothetical protein F4809DRAFT_649585 [Biscogniauxia mediterranea]
MGKIAKLEYFRVPPRWLFVKITDDSGSVGWGEASLEGHTQAVEGCLDSWADRFMGFEADDIEHIWQTAYRGNFYRGGPVLMSALSGIDIALWDLKARKLNVPIYQLLGGKVRDKLRVYAWIGGDRPSDVEAQANARKAQGFDAIKMNGTEDLGWLDSPQKLEACVERVRAVRALGLDAGVDFHGRVHKPMAKQLVAKLEPLDPLFIEEPLLSENIGGIKQIAAQTHLPIALGERLHSRWDVRPFLEAGCVDILQPDISHVGGISEMRRIAAACETYDVALAPHCPLGPIALAANVQIDATSPNFVIQEMSLGIHYNVGGQDLTSYTTNPEVWKVTGGYIDLMSGPGLGIEIDENQVRELSKDSKAWKRKGNPTRTRVSRACDRCKSRKTRCSGKYPCVFCLELGIACQFTAPYRRGRPPFIESSHPDGLRSPNDVLPRNERSHRPLEASIPNLGGGIQSHIRDPREISSHINSREDYEGNSIASDFNSSRRPTSAIQSTTMDSSRNSPEPLQADRQGHMVGPSSGVSFLLRLQKKLAKQASHYSSESSIFTFGDLPLPEPEGSFFILPTKAEAQELLGRYFDFAVATHRFLHRRTMELWLDELYETSGKMRVKDGARSRTALIFMMFAHATQFSRASHGQDPESSVRFFLAADHQLSEEKGEVRLTSIQARLCQCFYLLAESRINHCWSLFGTLAHLVLALGIHRRSRRSETTNSDVIESECRKRTFWVAYSLDAYLGAALGRPRAFHDEDINQEFPARVDEISRIIASVLREFYSLRTPSSVERVELAAKFTDELRKWREDMSALLDHRVLIVHRPFLLNNFANLSSYGSTRTHRKHQGLYEQNVKQCLNAAMQITKLIQELEEGNQLHRAFWFTYYFSSCAVVVLYVYCIQQGSTQPDTCLSYFSAASDCQSRIIKNARDGSWVQRYGMVLEELRLEVLRHNQALRNRVSVTTAQVGTLDYTRVGNGTAGPGVEPDIMTSHSQHQATYPTGGVNYGAATGPLDSTAEQFVGISPSSSVIEMTTWDQFDSLLTGGFGNLDTLLSEHNGNWAWK